MPAAGDRDRSYDSLIREGIAQRRLMSFVLDGCPRVAEPHDYGIHKGVPKLFFYQVGGRSRSGAPHGWRWAILDRIEEPELLAETFAGPRFTPSGRHVEWDRLLASVSNRS